MQRRQLLLRYLRPQLPTALIMGLCLLFATGLHLAGPWVIRAFINGVSAGTSLESLLRLALLFAILSVAAQAVRVLAEYLSEQVAWTATNALRLDLTAHLLRLDAAFHKERTPGELIERVDGDIRALSGFFSSFVIKLLGSLLLLLGILASLAAVHSALGLSFALFAAVAAAVLVRVRSLATPALAESRERSAEFYGFVGEVLTATEDLRAAGASGYVMGRFHQYLRGWLPVEFRAAAQSSIVWVTVVIAFAIGDALAYGLGGGLFWRGAIPLGPVYLVTAYAAMLGQPLETLRTQLQSLQRADASIARVTALQELSFRLEPGRTLGLLGRTGSGKSTLARLLFRLYNPDTGALRLGGLDLRLADLRDLHSRIGLVTQEVQLFAATARENITLFDPSISDERLWSILQSLGLQSWAERLPQGLDTPLSPGAVSAGEAQLLALARVFLRDPGLVILDEASSRLDPATEALLGQALDRLLAGRTAIIIAHRLATVQRVDQVLILEKGRVQEFGPRTRLAADHGSRFSRLLRAGLTEVLQ